MAGVLPTRKGRINMSQGGREGRDQGRHWPGKGRHLDVGVLDQTELLLDLVELFLLPPDVGLQDPCPLLQLVFDGLKHAELC